MPPAKIDPTADASVIEALATQSLGPAPGAAPAAPPAAAPPAPVVTAQDKANTSTSPKTEAKTSDEQPVTYKVQMDGTVREFTPEQIAQTTKRYADLNYRHQTEVAPIKPAIDILNKVMSEAKAQGQNITGDELATFLTSVLSQAANSHNTQFGAQSPNGQKQAPAAIPGMKEAVPTTPPVNADDFEAQLAQWEADNAVTLPPAYKNMVKQNAALMGEIGGMRGQMSQLLQHMQGVQKTAEGQLQTANQSSNVAYMRTIANNLAAAQMKFGLQDAQEKDFLMFAGERGYSVEDFIDPSLTEKVVADFKAVKDTPEMDRLRQINQRRQAFTGTLSPGAAGPGSEPPAPNKDENFINSVAEKTLKDRNLL